MKISHSNSDLALILAAQDGSIADTKRALQDGANVNCTTVVDPYENVTPLMLASRNGHNRVVKVLIDADADVRKSTSCIVPGEPARETALHWAIAAGNVAGCKMLVNAGGGVDAKSTRGTPLSYAIDSGSTAIVRLLLASGASVNSVAGNDCRSPLEWAAESGRADIVKVLLQNGAKPKPNPRSKKTPLMLA